MLWESAEREITPSGQFRTWFTKQATIKIFPEATHEPEHPGLTKHPVSLDKMEAFSLQGPARWHPRKQLSSTKRTIWKHITLTFIVSFQTRERIKKTEKDRELGGRYSYIQPHFLCCLFSQCTACGWHSFHRWGNWGLQRNTAPGQSVKSKADPGLDLSSTMESLLGLGQVTCLDLNLENGEERWYFMLQFSAEDRGHSRCLTDLSFC